MICLIDNNLLAVHIFKELFVVKKSALSIIQLYLLSFSFSASLICFLSIQQVICFLYILSNVFAFSALSANGASAALYVLQEIRVLAAVATISCSIFLRHHSRQVNLISFPFQAQPPFKVRRKKLDTHERQYIADSDSCFGVPDSTAALESRTPELLWSPGSNYGP